MKKIFRFIVLVVCLVFALTLVGCGEGGEQKQKGTIEDIEKYVLETVKVNVTKDIFLPTTHPDFGGEITWLSTDTDYILPDGTIVDTGGTKAVDVALGYIINYNDEMKAGDITIHLAPITVEDAAERFETCLPRRTINGEPKYFAARDIKIVSDYYGVINVEVVSSNPDVFSAEGKYNKPTSDTDVTLTVTVSDSYESITTEYVVTVQGRTPLEIVEDGLDWLENNFLDMYLTSDTNLPTKCENIGADITWSCTNPYVVSEDGKVTESVFERYVQLTATVKYDTATQKTSFWCKVRALDTSKMTEQEVLEKYLEANAQPTAKKMNFVGYGNITQSYGFLYFYDGKGPVITRAIVPNGTGNKPDQNRTATAFIVVHDTANSSASADASMHSRYINNGSGGAQTSWHYSVGDDAIYQQLEDDEISWNAGDGSVRFGLNDTGVKATQVMPAMSFSDDGYYVLGGVKTNIKLPSGTKNKVTGPYGIYTEIGSNGNYWINNSHYDSTYGAIGNNGGNRDAVSMETCVNNGSDYTKTFINAAKLCTKLIRKYNLSVDRILQHNNFSGKPCPNAIRQSGYWANFRDLCSSMKYGLDHFGDYNFEWTTSDPTKIDNTGLISLKGVKGETLSYSVKVTKNNVTVLEKNYTVTLA